MQQLNAGDSTSLQERKDFKNTPVGQYNLWSAELKSSEKTLKNWKKKGDKIVSRYLDSRNNSSSDINKASSGFKLNLFHSNVTTLNSMLYGNIPTVDVSRRYADSNDDVGRVASMTMERLLNCDITENGKEYDVVLRSTLLDRLTAGLGAARVRYEVETEGEGENEVMKSEAAPIDYYYWNDVIWSWARNWTEVRWLAFRSYLTKEQVRERFGDKAAEGVELKKQHSKESEGQSAEDDKQSSWMKAEIWEIWDKEKKEVVWYSEGYNRILDTKKDPLKLKGFFPCPPFFLANPTSTLYIPTPDFTLSEDLYNEIDTLQTRISILTEAVKAVGVYDSAADGIKRMFNEGVENELIPVENWALFAEKGGIQGQVDWVPIGDIVNALDKLRSVRDETITLLQQVSGMADVMQGGVNNQYEGTGQSQLKAKFGSIRIQALQDEFAQFASDLLQLKAEVIAIHFDPQSIAEQSNMQHSMDKELLPQAIELIKNPRQARLRVAIRPESVAMVDYAQLKAERTDYINALSMFMQSATPLMESDPAAKPFLLELLKWGLAGFKGAQEIEGVMDKAIEASVEAEKEKQENPQPDPEAAKEQAKLQGEMQKIDAKGQMDMQVRDHDKQADMETAQMQTQLDTSKIDFEKNAAIEEIQMKGQVDVQAEEAKSQSNTRQSVTGTQAEAEKETHKANLAIETEQSKVTLDNQAENLKQDREIEKARQLAAIQIETASALADIEVAKNRAIKRTETAAAKQLIKANPAKPAKKAKNDNV
jgi:hypothetical protein